MYKTRLAGCVDGPRSPVGYVETDPSGRYGRFREILGKGAMKTVYRAFDEVLGMEVAWSQVKLNEIFRSPEELQRLYSEVHLLKNLKHECIMKFYTSWIDIDRRTFNFITEMFTSGTLREYRHKYQRVDIRAVKNWARQILRGLAYLHGHDPPVIHRDLKCDNIFVNGHLGQVKIGDLGLAAILRGSQYAHSVIGTPEFMAPELYEEEYDELVDIYSFGMCVLEMLTSEYPYSECSNPAQIYKKVTSGKLPEAFYRIEDDEARQFVGKCLAAASKRLPARELLLDPFLAFDEQQMQPIPNVPLPLPTPNRAMDENNPSLLVDPRKTTDMTITGTMNPEDDTIFLKVQISDKGGHTRNIYFPFDILNDTAIDVATEMVKELEIGEWEPMEIAEMIEEQISSLIPGWKESELSQDHHRHHSFYYEDDDNDEDNDNAHHHPFYSTSSSRSSSQASLSFDTPAFHRSPSHERSRGEVSMNDDASSQSSSSSLKYSSLNYCSGNEYEYETSSRGRGGVGGELHSSAKCQNFTRFGPADILSAKQRNLQKGSWGIGSSNQQKNKLTRIQSMVDVRSQLLHKSLVEQINKRRLFKTVGAVENIGFQDPYLPADNDEKRRFEWRK